MNGYITHDAEDKPRNFKDQSDIRTVYTVF